RHECRGFPRKLMEISLRVGTAEAFFKKAREVALIGDERRPLDLAKPRLSMIFETQDDLDDAIASAWVHCHNPEAFSRFPSFARPTADPLSALDRATLERIDRSFGKQPPWIRRQSDGGMDVRGTIGISVLEGSNLAVLLVGVRLAMEHLAFLARYMNIRDNIEIRVTPDRKILYIFPLERQRPLGMYVQMQPQDDHLIQGLSRVIHSGGAVAILIPKTVNALDCLDRFQGGMLSELPLSEMLETRLSFSGHGQRATTVPQRLTEQEIFSLGALPASRVTAAEVTRSTR
ncbi:hypothetical protein, partial [Acidithiobacillus caldus]